MELDYIYHRRKYMRWTTAVPRVNDSRLSPSFRLKGRTWQFELETILDVSSRSEMWHLRMLRRDTKKYNADYFMISVFVRNRRGRFDSVTGQAVLDSHSETSILYGELSSLASQLQEVNFSRAKMTFMFFFDSTSLDFVRFGNTSFGGKKFDTPKEDKSVQTLPNVDDRPGSLSLDLRKLVDKGSNPDLKIRCGDTIIPAHELILSARSEVFQAMLESDMREGLEGFIEIADMEPEVFQLFLQYLYTDVLPELTADIALPLYKAGDKYKLEGLRRRCRDFVVENLSAANACEILIVADTHSDKDLKESAVSFLSTKNIAGKGEKWASFSRDHPSLACEVLFRALQAKAKIS